MNNTRNWFYQNPIKTILFFSLTIILLFLIIIEFSLRFTGYVPQLSLGYWKDTLVVYNSHYADSEGVFKHNLNYDFGPDYIVNSDGFRGVEFDTSLAIDGKKKILFLGDSFTRGGCAKPITKSFADLVAKEGYIIYNTGIGGTDPAQYAFLAGKYIPILKPDIVMVFFYVGNDIMTQERELKPNENLFHITNKGWIYAYVDGKYIDSPQKALELHQYGTDKGSPKYYIRNLFYKTVVGSRIWDALSKVKKNFTYSPPHSEHDSMISNSYLRKIKYVCEQYETILMLYLIPNRNDISMTKTPANIFKGFKPYICKELTIVDYHNEPNAHFNNSGHKKYSEFILSKLDSL